MIERGNFGEVRMENKCGRMGREEEEGRGWERVGERGVGAGYLLIQGGGGWRNEEKKGVSQWTRTNAIK